MSFKKKFHINDEFLSLSLKKIQGHSVQPLWTKFSFSVVFQINFTQEKSEKDIQMKFPVCFCILNAMQCHSHKHVHFLHSKTAIIKIVYFYGDQSLAMQCTWYVYYGNTGCGVFKEGIQNWKDFWLKINCSQMKLLDFENWSSAHR